MPLSAPCREILDVKGMRGSRAYLVNPAKMDPLVCQEMLETWAIPGRRD